MEIRINNSKAMLSLPLMITILCTPSVLQAQRQQPSCGEFCYYDKQVQKADCSNLGLHDVPTMDGCESTRFLIVRDNNIPSILENHMLGNRGAQHLDFSLNKISNVEPRSFAGCNNVAYVNIYLTSNQIAILRNETFSGCEKSLQQLHLDRNELEVIEGRALKNLTKLARLLLGYNKLKSLNKPVFDDLHSLESLFLNSNQLTSLPGDLLASASRLKHLDLSNNMIVVLGDEIFSQCPHLVSVVLHNNQLDNIPSLQRRPFSDGLLVLDIRNNSITNVSIIMQFINATEELLIDGNPFHCDCNTRFALQRIQQEMTYSQLKCIMPVSGETIGIRILLTVCPSEVSSSTSPATRQSTPYEENQCFSLSASNGGDKNRVPNHLLLLVVIFFASQRRILKVVFVLSVIIYMVVHAQPPSCGDVCYYDGQFQIADCSGIGLQEVPTRDGCDSARLLDLSYNNIASLHEDDMIGNRGAEHLDLSFNSISYVEPRSFSGSNSVTYLNLYLSSNQIAILRNETFTECEESLQQLHLDRNKISVIESGAFRGLTQVAHLFLGHNNLQSLEAAIFQDLVSLESLYLNSNRLSSLPGALFATLSNLKHLDLSSNNLFILDDEIFNQRFQLMTVVLSNNRLRNIPNPLRNPSLNRLQALDIRNNNITDATNITSYIYVTKKLFIDDNPFHCDCNFKNLRKWVQQEVTSSELQCTVPSTGERRKIRSLPELCPNISSDTTDALTWSSSHEGEQDAPNTARPENGIEPKLPTYSSDVLAEQMHSQEDPREVVKQTGGESETLHFEKDGSWSDNPKRFVLLVITGIPASIVIFFLIIFIKYRYRKSSKQRKYTTPSKIQSTPDTSTPKDSGRNASGVRKRTPQSTDKMITSNNSPDNITKRDYNVRTTSSEHVRFQDGHGSGRVNVSNRRLQNQYEACQSEIAENGGEWDELGTMPMRKRSSDSDMKFVDEVNIDEDKRGHLNDNFKGDGLEDESTAKDRA